jgi:hypothetical protein
LRKYGNNKKGKRGGGARKGGEDMEKEIEEEKVLGYGMIKALGMLIYEEGTN